MHSEVSPGKKIVTIGDLAEALGVHKSTVSTALSGKGRVSPAMRARVLKLAEELGYEPDPLAQRLANRANNKTVCLCSGALDPGLATEKIALIQSALTDMGLEVPIYAPAPFKAGVNSQVALYRQLRRSRPLAIVCSVYSLQDEALAELEAYQQEGGIVVSYDIPIALQCDQVVFDREDNAYQGAKYLLERGHRDIGIGMTRVTLPHARTPQNLRLQGFQRAMDEWNTTLHSEWIFENMTFENGGAEMARHFLELPTRPTGLCIVNDYVTLAFMTEIIRAGVRVPEDVSIIGHDNHTVAKYCPVPLTSVSQPAEEIAQAVVAHLARRLQGDNSPPQTTVIRGEIIERQSVRTLS
jgi:DNA-binding LacI/PurR family transcriptional regulator